jgi:hypothetical protein
MHAILKKVLSVMYEMQNFQQQVDLIPFHNEKCSSVEHSILKIMNKKTHLFDENLSVTSISMRLINNKLIKKNHLKNLEEKISWYLLVFRKILRSRHLFLGCSQE